MPKNIQSIRTNCCISSVDSVHVYHYSRLKSIGQPCAAQQISPAIPEPLVQVYEILTLHLIRHVCMLIIYIMNKFEETETNSDSKRWTNPIQANYLIII